jgi:hypothetical protein
MKYIINRDGDSVCPTCGGYGEIGDEPIHTTSYVTHRVPVPKDLSKRRQGIFASLVIKARNGDKDAQKQIDQYFSDRIEGWDFIEELDSGGVGDD